MSTDVFIIECECGSRMTVPRTRRHGRVECPVCNKRHTIPASVNPLFKDLTSKETPSRLPPQAPATPAREPVESESPSIIVPSTRRRRPKRQIPEGIIWTFGGLGAVVGLLLVIYVVNTFDSDRVQWDTATILGVTTALFWLIAIGFFVLKRS